MTDDALRLAVDAFSDLAFVTLGPDGRITFWNQGAQRLLGHEKDEAVGHHLSAFFAGSDHSVGITAADLEAAAQGGAVAGERWLRHRDGSAVHTRTTIVPIRDGARSAGYAAVVERIAPSGALAPHPGAGGCGTCAQLQQRLSEAQALLAAESADRTQADAARLRLLRRLIAAQEDERRRIAGNLHDDLGQRVTALRLQLESFATQPQPSDATPVIDRALRMVAALDQDLDYIAWELRPAALDELGLPRVLATYVNEWSQHTRVRTRFEARPVALERLPPEVETSVYRIAQEALHNVAKHAAARLVSVVLDIRDDAIALAIQDDGVGSDGDAGTETMLGVAGMRERAYAVGGTLRLEPTPGGGTTVRLTIPLAIPRTPTSSGASPGSERPPASTIDNSPGADWEGAAPSSIRLRLQELQHAIAARDEFIATVAHELRNPISPLTFQVRLTINKVEQMAAAATPVSHEWIQSQLRRTEERLHRLLETLDRLLDVSRLSTGRIDLQLEAVDLAEVTREVVQSLEAELAVARCSLTISEEGATTGQWDRLRVEQICRNLLSNAMRFGAGRPIHVSLVGDGDNATLRVCDQGIGIAADQQAAIFERFERGTAQRSGGFGIGLWIVRSVCAAMGGAIRVESEVGQGACFTVTLPRRLTMAAVTAESE